MHSIFYPFPTTRDNDLRMICTVFCVKSIQWLCRLFKLWTLPYRKHHIVCETDGIIEICKRAISFGYSGIEIGAGKAQTMLSVFSLQIFANPHFRPMMFVLDMLWHHILLRHPLSGIPTYSGAAHCTAVRDTRPC